MYSPAIGQKHIDIPYSVGIMQRMLTYCFVSNFLKIIAIILICIWYNMCTRACVCVWHWRPARLAVCLFIFISVLDWAVMQNMRRMRAPCRLLLTSATFKNDWENSNNNNSGSNHAKQRNSGAKNGRNACGEQIGLFTKARSTSPWTRLIFAHIEIYPSVYWYNGKHMIWETGKIIFVLCYVVW